MYCVGAILAGILDGGLISGGKVGATDGTSATASKRKHSDEEKGEEGVFHGGPLKSLGGTNEGGK
jgi:hypothetical protein